MDELEKLLKKIVSLNQDVLLKRIYSDSKVEQFIVSLNTEGVKTSQLYELGEDSKGQSLGNYTDYSIQLKLDGFGDSRIDHITLKDTGDFYESFEVQPLKAGFRIKANPLKDGDDLTEHFGEDIIGLNENNKKILARFILPYLQEEIKRAIME